MLSTKEMTVEKHVAVINLDVGSAIEYAGTIFISWAKEMGYNVHVYSVQTEPGHLLNWLVAHQPDLIIMNEYHHRPCATIYLYQALNDTPIIHIDHVWERLVNWADSKDNDKYSEIMKMWYELFLSRVDYAFCLNSKPLEIAWNWRTEGRTSNRYYPTDDSIFYIKKPWSDRTKMFCYIGNILDHKLSGDFLAKVCETDLVVDCYGSTFNQGGTYDRAFDRAQEMGNINYKGYIPQDRVADVMNEYKYLVLPHNGNEPFNWVLKQCAYCGTIPLITNDRDSTLYKGKWLDWAAGLYMGCKYTDDFIKNLETLVAEQPDHSGRSEYISKTAMTIFPYQKFKEEFQNKVRELLNGKTYNMGNH